MVIELESKRSFDLEPPRASMPLSERRQGKVHEGGTFVLQASSKTFASRVITQKSLLALEKRVLHS